MALKPHLPLIDVETCTADLLKRIFRHAQLQHAQEYILNNWKASPLIIPGNESLVLSITSRNECLPDVSDQGCRHNMLPPTIHDQSLLRNILFRLQ